MCKQRAEWVLFGNDPYSTFYSCTRHLSQMVTDDTVQIEAYPETCNEQHCCFLFAFPWPTGILFAMIKSRLDRFRALGRGR